MCLCFKYLKITLLNLRIPYLQQEIRLWKKKYRIMKDNTGILNLTQFKEKYIEILATNGGNTFFYTQLLCSQNKYKAYQEAHRIPGTSCTLIWEYKLIQPYCKANTEYQSNIYAYFMVQQVCQTWGSFPMHTYMCVQKFTKVFTTTFLVMTRTNPHVQ